MSEICIIIIIGTRHESIKMSPVVRACERRGLDWFVVHTGQGCSCDVDRAFFEGYGLPDAGYNLGCPGPGRGGIGVAKR